MYRVRSVLLGTALASLARFAFAAELPTVLLPPDSIAALKLNGAVGESARITNASVTGQPFKTVLRIEITKKPMTSRSRPRSTPRWPPSTS
jgi:hypothetical protein